MDNYFSYGHIRCNYVTLSSVHNLISMDSKNNYFRFLIKKVTHHKRNNFVNSLFNDILYTHISIWCIGKSGYLMFYTFST